VSLDTGFEGGKCVKFTTNGEPQSVFLSQQIAVEPNTEYLLIMYYKTDSGSPSPGYPLVTPEYSFFYNYAWLPSEEGEWSQFAEKKNSGSRGSLKLSLILWHQEGSVWFDKVQIYKLPLKVELQVDKFKIYDIPLRFETQGRVSLIKKGQEQVTTVVKLTNVSSKSLDCSLELDKTKLKRFKAELETTKITLEPGARRRVKVTFKTSPEVDENTFEYLRLKLKCKDLPKVEQKIILCVARERKHPYVFFDREDLKEIKERTDKHEWAKKVYENLLRSADNNLKLKLADIPREQPKLYEGNSRKHVWSFGQGAYTLAKAYALSGKENYAAKAAEILLWYADHYLDPVYSPKTKTQGRVTPQTINETAFGIRMVGTYDLIAESKALNDKQCQHIEEDLLRAIARNIRNNDTYWVQCSNWGAVHLGAIGSIGFCLRDAELIERAIDQDWGFCHYVGHDVLGDGFWWEGSPGYHFYSISGGLLPLAEAAWHSGIDLYTRQVPSLERALHGGVEIAKMGPSPQYKSLEMMLEVPIHLAFSDGELPTANDTHGVNIFKRPGYEYAAKRCPNNQFFQWVVKQSREKWGRRSEVSLLHGLEELKEVKEFSLPSTIFGANGFAMLKSSDGKDANELAAFLDFGPHGAYHSHLDKLNIILRKGSHTLLDDPGSPGRYGIPVDVHWCKKSVSHNVVLVNGRPQRKTWGKLEAFVDAPGMKMVAASAPISENSRQQRSLFLTDTYLAVLDVLKSTEPVTYDWFLHGEGSFSPPPEGKPYPEFKDYGEGYDFIQRAKKLTTDKNFRTNFILHHSEQEKGVVVGLDVFLVGGTETDIVTGLSPGRPVEKLCPTLMARRKGNQVEYLTLLSVKSTPVQRVCFIKKLPVEVGENSQGEETRPLAFQVYETEFKNLVLFSGKNTGSKQFSNISTDSVNCALRLNKKGRFKQIVLDEAKFLERREMRIDLSNRGTVSVKLQDQDVWEVINLGKAVDISLRGIFGGSNPKVFTLNYSPVSVLQSKKDFITFHLPAQTTYSVGKEEWILKPALEVLLEDRKVSPNGTVTVPVQVNNHYFQRVKLAVSCKSPSDWQILSEWKKVLSLKPRSSDRINFKLKSPRQNRNYKPVEAGFELVAETKDNISVSKTFSLELQDQIITWGIIKEAEDIAEERGGQIRRRTDKPNMSQACFSHWDKLGHALTWRVNIPEAGKYNLVFRYATADKVALRDLRVDDASEYWGVRFPSSGGWSNESDNWRHTMVSYQEGKPVVFELGAGEHTITMVNKDGQGCNLDYFAFVPCKK